MNWTGGSDQRSVRSIMQFMMSPLNGPGVFEREEATFRDVREHLLTLAPPKYPLAIDRAKADAGRAVFETTCARCHGTYGPNSTYPNKIVPIDEIGTDRRRFDGIARKFGEHYNDSWFAKEAPAGYPVRSTPGYQAPPLDGIWATAPYFHNGSAPTVWHVLQSKSRPRVFTRSYRTDRDDYDAERLGWKVQTFAEAPAPTGDAVEDRKIYDTAQPGRGNGGHTFGDRLTDDERWAVIEYLKTL
jgi:mono/diheme cytochrome c family protein